MPATTSRLALSYPLNGDPPNGASQIQTLADDLDTLVTAYTSGTAGARPTTPSEGAGTVYLATDTLEISFYNGSAWVDIGPAITLLLLQAKGDLLVASAAGAVSRLGVGSDGKVLTARSTATLGVDWEPGGGELAYQERATITAANTYQNAAAYTPAAQGRFACFVSFDVPSGGAAIAAQVTYTRAGTARTDTIYPTGQGNVAQGSWSPAPLFIDADAAAAITIEVQSSSTSTVVTSSIGAA